MKAKFNASEPVGIGQRFELIGVVYLVASGSDFHVSLIDIEMGGRSLDSPKAVKVIDCRYLSEAEAKKLIPKGAVRVK